MNGEPVEENIVEDQLDTRPEVTVGEVRDEIQGEIDSFQNRLDQKYG